MTKNAIETIYAIATPPGVGGVGVTRVSGPDARNLGEAVTGKTLKPRRAQFSHFYDADALSLDSGIVLYFPQPGSFTGEEVVEFQGHGGSVVQHMLGRRLAELGARAARPGEFSERAFLNGKLDLAQAEAVADLVVSGSEAAARAAQRSLEGVFSARVDGLQATLIDLRVFIEAALDFPDEEIDFIAESDVLLRLEKATEQCNQLLEEAHRGQVLRDGLTVAIIGQPNAGKSSLLNTLAGYDAAIVTSVPGTTRDVLRESLSLDGIPVHIADTAGIRDAEDVVEAEGIRRAREVLKSTDLVLLLIDVTADLAPQLQLAREVPESVGCLAVCNKIDLATPPELEGLHGPRIDISATTGEGVESLVDAIKAEAGLPGGSEGAFSARVRHVNAMKAAVGHLLTGKEQLETFQSAETLAEELRLAQRCLGEITGEYLPDDLLGAIFSSFCIGK